MYIHSVSFFVWISNGYNVVLCQVKLIYVMCNS